jgi:hypothetical protein
MTKKQLKQKTRELIRESAANMRKNIEKAINSGAIDLDAYDDNYELPKIVLGALLRYEEWNYKMHTDEGRREVNNLFNCM